MWTRDPRLSRWGRRLPAGVLSAVLLAVAMTAQDAGRTPALAGRGPMRELLARGVAAAPMTAGLSFALTITNDGHLVAGPWSLRVPGASPLTLSLEEPAWEADALEAVASLRNGTGAFLGGARLDFLEISQGSSGRGGRAISLPSPLFFGDLQPGGEASLPFRLEPLGLSSDSPNTVIRGIVTGVVAAGTADLPDSADPVAIDAAGTGVLYVGDGSGKAIFRVAADLQTIRKYDAGCPVTDLYGRRPDPNYDPIAAGNMSWDLYKEMWGSHGEYVIDGNLVSAEYTDRLSSIHVPTLITAGDHDECDPSLSRVMHEKIAGSKLVIFPESGHMTFVDQPAMFVKTVEDFLKEK